MSATDGADQPHLEIGWAHEEAGEHELAEAAFRLALEATEPDAEYALGMFLTTIGRAAEAVPVLRAGLERGDTDLHLLLGNAMDDLGDLDGALAQFVAAGEVGDAGGWHNAGDLLRWLGHDDEALVHWRRSHEAGETKPTVFASLLADLGHYDEAVGILEGVAAAGDADALVEVGAMEQERGHLDRAEIALREALGREATEAYTYLASVLGKTGRPSEALTTLERGAALGIGSAEMQLANELAKVDFCNDRIESLYRRAMEHGCGDARTNLGVHLLDLGRDEEAHGHLRAMADAGDELARDHLIAELSSGE